MAVSLDIHAEPGVLVLDGAERADIERLVEHLSAVPPRLVDHPTWLAAARDRSCRLPARVLEELRRFRSDPGPNGCLRIAGLPVRPEGPTPVEAGSVERNATASATLLALCVMQLGEIVAFRQEKSGALLQNVVPVPGQEFEQSNAGSQPLQMHVENVHLDHRPDFVSLLCLRNDHDDRAGLRVASIRQALPLVGPEHRRVLAEPRFRSTPPPSFAAGRDPVHAVLSGAEEDPDVRVDFANTHPLDAGAATALAGLRRAVEAVQTDLVLGAGDLVVVDNRVTLHGRSAFVPRYDGRDRWLQRAFVHIDHRRTRGLRTGDGNVLS
ncbi:TauD/TfdA family dioxygenase [Kitasatospora sp. NPDC093679]|uniref:TauD/TfdA family dioxygenase n=1 Tax=Kitasatospora sp. NPDC093679 TaxID=3154983 RepID=UPI003429859C